MFWAGKNSYKLSPHDVDAFLQVWNSYWHASVTPRVMFSMIFLEKFLLRRFTLIKYSLSLNLPLKFLFYFVSIIKKAHFNYSLL